MLILDIGQLFFFRPILDLLGDQLLGAAKNINLCEKILLALRLKINMPPVMTPIFDSCTFPLRETWDEMVALLLEFKHEVWQRLREGSLTNFKKEHPLDG